MPDVRVQVRSDTTARVPLSAPNSCRDTGCQDSSSEAKAELDGWILSNLQQHKLRRARVAALTKAAQPFQYDRAEVMLVIGTEMSTSVK
jgi:hypothetical protein